VDSCVGCVFTAGDVFAQLAQAPAQKYIEKMNSLERGIETKIRAARNCG
jgi:hypothetical protein